MVRASSMVQRSASATQVRGGWAHAVQVAANGEIQELTCCQCRLVPPLAWATVRVAVAVADVSSIKETVGGFDRPTKGSGVSMKSTFFCKCKGKALKED